MQFYEPGDEPAQYFKDLRDFKDIPPLLRRSTIQSHTTKSYFEVILQGHTTRSSPQRELSTRSKSPATGVTRPRGSRSNLSRSARPINRLQRHQSAVSQTHPLHAQARMMGKSQPPEGGKTMAVSATQAERSAWRVQCCISTCTNDRVIPTGTINRRTRRSSHAICATARSMERRSIYVGFSEQGGGLRDRSSLMDKASDTRMLLQSWVCRSGSQLSVLVRARGSGHMLLLRRGCQASLLTPLRWCSTIGWDLHYLW